MLYLDVIENTNGYEQDRIEEVIINFEPRVAINQIVVQDNLDRNEYKVMVSFYILNRPEPVTITEFLQRLR